jgi:Na+/phosphate symporter
VSGRLGAPARRDEPRRVDRLSLVVGVLFVLAGIVFLLDALDVWRLRGDYLVPLGLIVLGLAVLTSGVPLGTRRS